MLEGRASSNHETHALGHRTLGPQPRDLGARPHLRKRAHAGASLLRVVAGRPEMAPDSVSREREILHSIAALIDALSCALTTDHEQALRCARLAVQAFDAEIAAKAPLRPRSAGSGATPSCRVGLAPWQVRRVATYLDQNLADSIRCEDLAKVTRLSVSHFMRAFRESFGTPPHAYLMRRRMERAQDLMLSTDTTIGQIALDCGFADQSHLTRFFHKIVGESPAAWRRARVDVAMTAGSPEGTGSRR